MARKPRLNLVGIPQHIIQGGNNRQACFASGEDMAAYLHRRNVISSKSSSHKKSALCMSANCTR